MKAPRWNVTPLRRGQAGGYASAQARFDARMYEHGGVALTSAREPVAAPPSQHERIVLMRDVFWDALDNGASLDEARAAAMEVGL